AKKLPGAKLKGNQMSLWLMLTYEKATGDLETHPVTADLDTFFRPAGRRVPMPWRKLAVEVRPGSVWISWGTEEAVGPLPRAALERRAEWLIRDNRVPDRDRPDFSPSQGLGVYLANGKAAFRNVKVELRDDIQ